MNNLIIPAILTKYNPRKDKSVTISFETQELSTSQVMELHELMGKYGGLMFKPEDQLTKAEIKEIDELDFEMGGKSKSKRLMDVMYLLHKQEQEKLAPHLKDFKDYYAVKMEEMIIHFKNKLE
tara:strand:+ start:134 stop:502 length:369 start_codon:yes stop_codon:yes gene_type:complete